LELEEGMIYVLLLVFMHTGVAHPNTEIVRFDPMTKQVCEEQRAELMKEFDAVTHERGIQRAHMVALCVKRGR
jgi:hypothetical protein